MGRYKVITLVLACECRPFRSIERDGQRKTWAAPGAGHPANRTYFYYGIKERWERVWLRCWRGLQFWRPPMLRVRGDRLYCLVPEFTTLGVKMLASFSYVLRVHDFDYLFRTNTSSYVRLDGLVDTCNGLAKERVWGGVIACTPDGQRFVSGAGFLLSRDVVELVVRHADQWNHDLTDDVALAVLLERLGVEPRPLPRADFDHPAKLAGVTRDQLLDHFHFRCKAEDRRHDIETMHRIHRILQGDAEPGAAR